MDWDPEEVRRLTEEIPWIREIYLYPEVGSTNDVARDLGDMGAPEGVAVLADAQTRGRGRAGRSWWTPPGRAIALSLLVRPRRPVADWPQLGMVAGLAAVEAVRGIGCPAGLKWPNDLMIPPVIGEVPSLAAWRKAGGILVESFPPAFAVIGIGINVNIWPEEIPPDLREILGSLSQTLGRPIPRLAVLKGLLRAFASLYLEWNAGARLVERWAAALIMLGRPVRVLTPEGACEGIAEGVDEGGGLRVRLPDGREQRFHAGEVSLRG